MQKGIYSLILYVSEDSVLEVGVLGVQKLPMGYYVYTGSALGKGSSSLIGRVARHTSPKKKKVWHIDYLLASQNTTVRMIILGPTERRLECKINRCIKEKARVLISRFGASDCKEECQSHLLYLGKRLEPFGSLILSCYSKILAAED